ncbi:hypothetical protein F7725_027599 [Dissostichus mawsoni]|uniref:Uncharacterized protein n=1 Tax=Dissostichus mawsoni TaxID=36200 RepID=A0A7J5XDM3_DISMA|nr:hypothetical protein F7725_027599 [Dissostichus mawsoni]
MDTRCCPLISNLPFADFHSSHLSFPLISIINKDEFTLMVLSMLSQKIEPGTSTPRANATKEDIVGHEASASPLCGRKCTIAAEGTKVPATPPSPRNLLPYGHRKCHSLGYKSVFI